MNDTHIGQPKENDMWTDGFGIYAFKRTFFPHRIKRGPGKGHKRFIPAAFKWSKI